MSLRDLINSWEQNAGSALTEDEYSVRLTKKDAAKISALAEMYPGRTREQIITDLLSAALNELETNLPYVQGDKISSFDEMGDPIYEDVGPTSHFVRLVRKHYKDNNSTEPSKP